MRQGITQPRKHYRDYAKELLFKQSRVQINASTEASVHSWAGNQKLKTSSFSELLDLL